MIYIKNLKASDLDHCISLINEEKYFFSTFKQIGWSEIQIRLQFEKSVNYSLGLFLDNLLVAFMIGDLIFIENITEYEILLLYVKKSKRQNNLATKLIQNIINNKVNLKLKKIFLEVSKENKVAIKLYEKNDFKLIDIRKKYYENDNNKIDAFCYALNL